MYFPPACHCCFCSCRRCCSCYRCHCCFTSSPSVKLIRCWFICSHGYLFPFLFVLLSNPHALRVELAMMFQKWMDIIEVDVKSWCPCSFCVWFSYLLERVSQVNASEWIKWKTTYSVAVSVVVFYLLLVFDLLMVPSHLHPPPRVHRSCHCVLQVKK